MSALRITPNVRSKVFGERTAAEHATDGDDDDDAKKLTE